MGCFVTLAAVKKKKRNKNTLKIFKKHKKKKKNLNYFGNIVNNFLI